MIGKRGPCLWDGKALVAGGVVREARKVSEKGKGVARGSQQTGGGFAVMPRPSNIGLVTRARARSVEAVESDEESEGKEVESERARGSKPKVAGPSANAAAGGRRGAGMIRIRRVDPVAARQERNKRKLREMVEGSDGEVDDARTSYLRQKIAETEVDIRLLQMKHEDLKEMLRMSEAGEIDW